MRRHHHTIHSRPRAHGWTRTGIRLGLILLLAMGVTGIVLELWPAESAFSLAAWQALVRRGSLAAHGAGAWLVCAATGRWVAPHIRSMWRASHTVAWWLGLATLIVAAVTAATGLALLYGPGDWHEHAAQFHWWVSLAAPLLVVLHARRRKRG